MSRPFRIGDPIIFDKYNSGGRVPPAPVAKDGDRAQLEPVKPDPQ